MAISSTQGKSRSRPVPGGPESSAGDDFHLIWGARKALELLNLDGDLKALGIEGPSPDDSVFIDPEGDQLLGIDLTEYYGGDNFASASQVVHSQLKYSTRRSSVPWTAARLCQGRIRGTSGSIVHRLAQIFAAYLTNFNRDTVLQRLRLKLVSNRPISDTFAKAIAEAQQALQGFPNEIRRADLLPKLSPDTQTQVKRMNEAASLGSSQFTDFLRVLDFSDCGAESRFEQSAKLVRALGDHGAIEVMRQYSSLKILIHDRMMPEARHFPPLLADDIVPVFGLPSLRSAFPAETRFEPFDNPIDRLQLPQISRAIIEHNSGPICLHAGAGYGKTTVVRLLYRHFPESSVVVLFDCYGAGSYLDPPEIRHSHRRAIMQIANELGAKTGSALLLSPDLQPPDLLRAFLQRLKIAADLLRAGSREALVVIVVDGADNSLVAADQFKEKSFVSDLVRCEMPDGCRLVVTSRTHSRDLLRLPETTLNLELRPFEKSESAENLQRFFPKATQNEVDEFHGLSRGIPRVQAYALKERGASIEAVLSGLRPDGKTVEGIIDQQIVEASKKLGIERTATNICKSLVILPRPVPISYIAELAKINPDAVHDFCIDMWPGLRMDDGLVSFCDIDFEARLHDRFGEDRAWIDEAAKLLLTRAEDDPYATIHVADALYRSERFEDLRALVLEEKSLDIIKDHLQRRDTFIRRARLALKASISVKDRVEFVKLLLIAAEAAKTDKAVRKLIIENADLASRYGDPITVQRLYLSEKETGWYGPGNLRCAAIFARDEKTKERAREHLRAALGWLRWWMTLNKEERRKCSVSIDDITAGTEAILRLDGLDKAARWLSAWRPRSTVYEVVKQLTSIIIRIDGSNALRHWFDKAALRADLLIAAIEAFSKADASLPPYLVHRASEVWRRFEARGFKPSKGISSAGICLCEALAEQDNRASGLIQLFNIFGPAAPDYPPSLFGNEEEVVDLFLRCRSLRAVLQGEDLSVELLYPERLKALPEGISLQEKKRLEEERKGFDDIYKPLLPAYEFRARNILGQIDRAKADEQLQECLQRDPISYRIKARPEASHLSRLIALTLSDVALRIARNPAKCLEEVERVCIGSTGVGSISLRLALAEKILPQSILHPEALRLADAVREEIEQRPMVASEQIDIFIRCARIGDVIDPEVGRAYFKLAMESASDIDEEAYAQLACLSRLSRAASEDESTLAEPQLAFEFARFIEACHYRMEGWEHFPWTECLKGVTYLDPASGFAVLSRWDDRGVLNISDEILPILESAGERQFIAPTAAYALTLLSDPSDSRYCNVILSLLEQALEKGTGNRTILKYLFEQIAKDVNLLLPLGLRRHCTENILRWAQKNGFGREKSVQELERLYLFLQDLDGEGMRSSEEQDPHRVIGAESVQKPKAEIRWDEVLNGRTFSAPDEIEEAISAVSDPHAFGYDRLNELLERIKNQCPPSLYRAQIEALVLIDTETLPYYPLLEAIKSRLAQWPYHPSVREWKKNGAERIVSRRFHDFIDYDRFSIYHLNRLADIFEIHETEFPDLIAPVLPDFVEIMPAPALYDVTKTFIPSLPNGGAQSILSWILRKLSAKLKDDFGDGPWRIDLMPPRSVDDVLSSFFWSAFGHPDKRVRWRAAHSIRRMVHLGHPEIVEALVKRAEERQCYPFRNKSYPFYWLSARLWLLILLDRLASEVPDCVYLHANFIAREATTPETPHALIRYFAKKAALFLSERNASLYSASEVEELRKVSVSPYQQVEPEKNRTRVPYRHLDPQKQKERRFFFNSFDTIPYWYDPLGERFGLSGHDVARMAEYWICDRWGFTGEVWRTDPIRAVRRYDYTLSMHSHGSEPIVERLQTYLEYHAMFCVADQLLAERPLIKNEWEEDPWTDWLQSFNLTWEDSWLADRRDPTPLEPQFWTLDQRDEKTWKWEITSQDFDRSVGLTDPINEGFLVVDAYQYRYYYKDHEALHVSSALVSPQTAPALLRALQTTIDPHDYRIPPEGDELEIDKPDFQLKGWLREVSADWGGIDEGDPLRNQLRKSVVFPGKNFTDWANLCIATDGRRSWRDDQPGKTLTFFEHWNDCPQTRYTEGFRSEGYRLWIDVEELLRYLAERGVCLIMECQINRYSERHNNIGEYVPGYAKLYLIYSNGKVETLGRSYRLGKAPHRGT